VAGKSYAAQLGEVLRRRDAVGLKRFLLENARRFGDARQVAEVEAKSPRDVEQLMHRMILARADLQDLHPGSRAALARRDG
jgi:hypothetical protein